MFNQETDFQIVQHSDEPSGYETKIPIIISKQGKVFNIVHKHQH